MPVKKRVSKKPRASKSSRSSSRVMKRTQRKSNGKKTRTVKRRKQKAGESIQGKDLKKIIKLSSSMYKALLDHIKKFDTDKPALLKIVDDMRPEIERDIYISIEEPIGLIEVVDPTVGVDYETNYKVENSELWTELIPSIIKYYKLILPVDNMAPSCNIEEATGIKEKSILQRLKCSCKKLISKENSKDSVRLLECEGEGE